MFLTGAGNHTINVRRIWHEGAWPCCSPDGRLIVFTGNLDQPKCSLMMISVEDGAEPQVITPPDVNAKRPAWLPDSDEIAFNYEQKQIWTLAITSGHLQPFLDTPPDKLPAYYHPCAYPDERAVVVVSHQQSESGRAAILFKLAPDAAEPVVQLTSYPEVSAGRPGVSPDGKTVVFAGNAGNFNQGANQLWLVGHDGRSRRLEAGEAYLVQGRAPRWSPDGKWIACTSTRPRPDPDEATSRAVWIISADGNNAYRLTDYSLSPLQVTWSPDQTRLYCGGGGCALIALELPEQFHFSITDNSAGVAIKDRAKV